MAEDMDPMAEIRASFFVECEELLETLQENLQLLENHEGDDETINVIFRAVHSIKGGAGAFGMENLVEFAHSFETVLDEVRSAKLAVSPNLLKVCFQSSDFLTDLVKAVREETAIDHNRTQDLLAIHHQVRAAPSAVMSEAVEEVEIVAGNSTADSPADAATGQSSSSNKPTPYSIFLMPKAELFAVGNEPMNLLRQVAEIGDLAVTLDLDSDVTLETIAPEQPQFSWSATLITACGLAEIREFFEFFGDLCEYRIEAQKAPEKVAETFASEPTLPSKSPQQSKEPVSEARETTRAPVARKAPVAQKTVVRVDLERIERLVNLVGELVINQAMLSQSLEQSGLSPHSDALNGLEEFQRLTRDIQDSVMMIRAQPVKSLFQRMARIVREASNAVGKDVRLVTDGEATEVDKTVIERLADPLTHMIRNAVDHGIEASDVRNKQGKSQQGTISLSAMHKSGRVVITVKDDGAGIDRARVLAKAHEKGLVPADAILSDNEIDNLLFAPGFSTAKEVSDLSGRGVGMDVVKTAIQELGGKTTISSKAGEGTTFAISLPLTLAILDGMIVDVADETLVVPLNLVVETLTIDDLQVDNIRPGVVAVRVRGEFIPILDLGVALGYRPPLTDLSGRVVLIIAEDDGQRYAVLVDGIRDQRQVVIKGLDDSFYRARGVAAATILGDGRIALILDPKEIISTPTDIISIQPAPQLVV
ncbi:MAG: chemotaxis protein CheA [Pseudomonadota bacterium]